MKKPVKKKRRPDRLARIMNPTVRFWTGVSLIPGFFLSSSLELLLLHCLVFAVAVVLAGKRIRVFYYAMMILSITLFHLLNPVGRVLWELGPVTLTAGALEQGLMKGFTLSGLVLLSLFSVTPDLRFPGRLGGMLARTMYYFEEILNGRGRLEVRNIIGSMDSVLMQALPPGDESVPETESGTRFRGTVLQFPVIILLEVLVWGPVVFFFFIVGL
jgi:heptaprenyl diphosphate synthase